MKVKPLGDRVLLERVDPEEEKTSGGIYLPDTAKEKPMEAKVVEVGPGKRNEKGEITPLELKVGDKVIISKWGGTEIKIDGKEYTIIGEDEILARIEK